jgi:mitochondrial fission protein ELM1
VELGKSNSVLRWQPTGKENPYLGYVATADVLVVTGDSESMLAEAVASGKPVYIYPLPECFPGTLGKVRERFREWVVARATAGRSGYDASWSGGQGWQRRLCAFLLSRSLVLPPRNIKRLHQGLYCLGVARPFGTELVMRPSPALYEAERVARQVRAILRMQEENPFEAVTKEVESVMTKA